MSGPINPYDSPEANRPGMSGTTKVLMGLGIGFGVLLLLCCGGIGLSSYFMYSTMKDAFSTEPAKVRSVTDQITTISIPESFTPEGCMDMKLPFKAGTAQMAIYADKDADGQLMMFQFDSEKLANDRNMRENFERGMRQGREEQRGRINVKSSEEFETTIHNEPATFKIAEGTNSKSEDGYWEVTGHFQGQGGPAEFFFQVKSANFSKDQVLEMLKSMK